MPGIRSLACPAGALMTVLLTVAPACAFSLNKSISVGDGETSGGESTVNGSVHVGRDAVVEGELETVNGTVTVEENSRIEDVKTVNGAIRLAGGVTAGDVGSVNGTIDLGGGVTVGGEISVVNGHIGIGEGSRVARDVSNVNGAIDIAGTEIGGDLTTVNGNVTLSGETVLRGDLLVKKPNGDFRSDRERRKPKVVVGPGVQVMGKIDLEREVELYISESARVGGVGGVMTLDDAVRFKGDRP